MALKPGTRLGRYEIVELRGKGEVSRARNAKLGREVAVKVRPAKFGQDTTFLQHLE